MKPKRYRDLYKREKYPKGHQELQEFIRVYLPVGEDEKAEKARVEAKKKDVYKHLNQTHEFREMLRAAEAKSSPGKNQSGWGDYWRKMDDATHAILTDPHNALTALQKKIEERGEPLFGTKIPKKTSVETQPSPNKTRHL